MEALAPSFWKASTCPTLPSRLALMLGSHAAYRADHVVTVERAVLSPSGSASTSIS